MSLSQPVLRYAILLLSFFLFAASDLPVTLREAGDQAGILVGTAVRPAQFSEAAYLETLVREFSMVEPEDATKWWVIRRNQGSFDFAEGDAVVRFALAHGMKVRGTCLVWDHGNPAWLVQAHLTPDQLSQLLHEHIATVMKHYAGQIFAWDVVNEAMDENGRFKDSPWYNLPGIGLAGKGSAYVERAFRWAREADPHALLFYNEAEGEGMNRKSDAIYEMVKDFKRRGVPIDGIGLQLHISQLDFDTTGLARNIARLTALGLDVHITELDVSLPIDSADHASMEDLQRQADVYDHVVEACLQNRGCRAIQTWGFTDKYSWIGSHSRGTRGAALPFDRNYKIKPAYQAIFRQLTSRAGPSN